MSELGRLIRDQVRAALAGGRASPNAHVAAAVNVGGHGHSTSVYSDDDVTVVTRDGQTDVVRHRDGEGGGVAVGDPGREPGPR